MTTAAGRIRQQQQQHTRGLATYHYKNHTASNKLSRGGAAGGAGSKFFLSPYNQLKADKSAVLTKSGLMPTTWTSIRKTSRTRTTGGVDATLIDKSSESLAESMSGYDYTKAQEQYLKVKQLVARQQANASLQAQWKNNTKQQQQQQQQHSNIQDKHTRLPHITDSERDRIVGDSSADRPPHGRKEKDLRLPSIHKPQIEWCSGRNLNCHSPTKFLNLRHIDKKFSGSADDQHSNYDIIIRKGKLRKHVTFSDERKRLRKHKRKQEADAKAAKLTEKYDAEAEHYEDSLPPILEKYMTQSSTHHQR